MSEDINKLKEIQKELDNILKLKSTARLLDKEEFEAYKETLRLYKEGGGSLKELQLLQKNINRSLIEAEASVSGIRDAFAAAVNELTGMNSGLNRARKSFKGLESLADQLSNDQADISRLSLKELKTIEEKVKKRHQELKVAKFTLQSEIDSLEAIKNKTPQQDKQLDLKRAALNATKIELKDFEKQRGLSQDLINQANKRIAAENQIIKTMGAAPAILEGVGKALQKLGLPDFGIKEAVQNAKDIIRVKNEEFEITYKIAQEELKELKAERKKLIARKASTKELKENQKLIDKAAKVGDKRVNSTEALGDVLGQVGKKFKEQLTTANLIQSAISLTIDAFIKMDKLSGSLAKNIGVSYDESLALQKNFNQIALNSDNIMVSTSALNESFASLNKRFQGATGFSNEMLESFTALTKQAGFSEEAIGNIAVVTGTQGKELESNLALMQGQLTVMNAQNGISFSEKQLVQDIGKISKATLLTLRNQPKAVARTLMTSKKLVLSFAEMESIASSLLDFEGSIQNELSAELLTGKQLNLEQARLLALKGDVAGASAEVAKQVGNAAEFEKMNVIQQEALAKAAGLTRDQLANSLMEREALAKLGGKDKTALEAYNRLKKQGLSDEAIAGKLGNDRLAAQLKSQSVQERFAASIERLKEIFNDVATAIMPIASVIADMVVGISKFVAKFSFILKPLLLIVGAFKAIKLITGGINKGMGMMSKLSKTIKNFKLSELKTSLGIEGIRKRILLMQQKGFVKAKLSNILAKVGLLTDKQSVFYKSRMTYFANQKLNKDMMSANFEKASLLQSIKITAQKRLQSIFGKEGYLSQLKTNIAEKSSNALKAIGNQFTKKGLIYRGLIYAKDLAINAAKGIYNKLSALGLGFNKKNLFYRGAIFTKNLAINAAEKIGNGLKAVGNQFTKQGLIYKGLVYAKDLAIIAAEKIGNGLKLIGNQFTKQGLMYKGLVYAKDLAINIAQKIGNGLKLIGNQFTKEGLMYQGLIYAKQLAINLAEKVGNGLKFIGLQFTKEGYVYQGLTYLKELAINTAKGIGNALSSIGLGLNQENLILKGLMYARDLAINATQIIGNSLLSAKIFLQKFLNREKLIEGAIMLKNFAKSAAEALLSVGKLALNAAMAVASIPVVGPILAISAAAAAVAGGMALYSKFKKPAGDMIGDADGKTQVSPAEGGLFELSNNDQFVAAPGVADAVTGKNKSKNASTTEGSDSQLIAVLNSKLDQIIAINQRIAAVSGNKKQDKITLEMFGNEVGNGVQKDGRKLQ